MYGTGDRTEGLPYEDALPLSHIPSLSLGDSRLERRCLPPQPHPKATLHAPSHTHSHTPTHTRTEAATPHSHTPTPPLPTATPQRHIPTEPPGGWRCSGYLALRPTPLPTTVLWTRDQDSPASSRPTHPHPWGCPSLHISTPSLTCLGWVSGSSRASRVSIYLCLCVSFVIGASLVLFLGAWQ